MKRILEERDEAIQKHGGSPKKTPILSADRDDEVEYTFDTVFIGFAMGYQLLLTMLPTFTTVWSEACDQKVVSGIDDTENKEVKYEYILLAKDRAFHKSLYNTYGKAIFSKLWLCCCYVPKGLIGGDCTIWTNIIKSVFWPKLMPNCIGELAAAKRIHFDLYHRIYYRPTLIDVNCAILLSPKTQYVEKYVSHINVDGIPEKSRFFEPRQYIGDDIGPVIPVYDVIVFHKFHFEMQKWTCLDHLEAFIDVNHDTDVSEQKGARIHRTRLTSGVIARRSLFSNINISKVNTDRLLICF